nr:PREDICTED: endothelin-converting enzyme 2-like isoform X1 [Bemisia tabaci]
MRLLAVFLLLKLSAAADGFSLPSVFKQPEPPCSLRRCIQSAAFILQSMNQSVNPCEDFFSYTCGNYNKENPIPDSQIMNDLNRRKEREYELKAKAMLQEGELDEDPESVKKAKMLFHACTNTAAIEEEGLDPIANALEVAGLDLIPYTPQDFFDWLGANVNVQKRLGKEILLQFTLVADPQNKTLKHLGLGIPGDWTFVTQPHHRHERTSNLGRRSRSVARESRTDAPDVDVKEFLEQETYHDEIDFAKNVLAHFIRSASEKEISKSQMKKMKKAVADAVVVDHAVSRLQTKYDLPDDEPTKHTLKELQTILDTADRTRSKSPINLTRYFTEMFKDVENLTLHLTDDTPIMVTSLDYLLQVSNLTKTVSPRRLAMMFWWRIVKSLAPLSTRAMRDMAHDFQDALYGFEYDVKSRALLCTQTVLAAFSFPVAHKIMDRSYLERIKPGVTEMFENLRRAFKQNIASYKWLHDADKQAMTEKLDAVKFNVGLPDLTFDREVLDEYYSDIYVCEEHYAQVLVNYSSYIVMTTLASFNQTFDSEEEADTEWGSLNLFTSNAFYFPEKNSMVILMPQLEHPFYDLGLEALNYGALGSLIGHELSHAFDNSGRTYDKIGNKVVKWMNSSVVNYVNKTECFVDQYSAVYIPEVDRHVDGRKTLNENIADNSGLRLALTAYRMWVQDHGKEKLLPGLEGLSHEQLFYLSFAGADCHSISDQGLLNLLQDEHSPTKVRVNITLTNIPDFFTAWKCEGPNTNHRKCRLL